MTTSVMIMWRSLLKKNNINDNNNDNDDSTSILVKPHVYHIHH